MGFLNILLGSEEPQKDFNLILNQINSYHNMIAFIGDKETINEKINEYLAFNQLTKLLNSVSDEQLEKVIELSASEEQKELITTIQQNHWKHEQIETFITLFENGKADPSVKGIKILHQRDELGINSITFI